MPSTVDRVPEHTCDSVNAAISAQTEQDIIRYSEAGPTATAHRLSELEQEWDIERALEANAASISLVGIVLGALVSRKFFALPAIVAGFLLQHALQGWCPPMPVLRRFGFRTQNEIASERFALKALRGDFDQLNEVSGESSGRQARAALRAVNR